MAMVAFVFLPIILKSMQSGGGGGNPTVVTTDKFGDLNENGIRRLIWQRQVVRRFVQRAGLAATGMPVQPQVLDALFGPVSEESVVDSWLMGQYAHEMGMRISDSIVSQFIQRITNDQLTGDELTAIANEMKISEDGLFVALKNELASLYFKQLYFASPGSLTVRPAWNDACRALGVLPTPQAERDDPDDPGSGREVRLEGGRSG